MPSTWQKRCPITWFWCAVCFGQLLGKLLSSLHAGETGMTNALYDGVANRCTAQRSPAYCMNVFTKHGPDEHAWRHGLQRLYRVIQVQYTKPGSQTCISPSTYTWLVLNKSECVQTTKTCSITRSYLARWSTCSPQSFANYRTCTHT